MIERIQQIGRPGWVIGEPRIECSSPSCLIRTLIVPIHTPSGVMDEMYDLSNIDEGEMVPGAALAMSDIVVGALVYAVREAGELRAVVLEWVEPLTQPEPMNEPMEEGDGGGP